MKITNVQFQRTPVGMSGAAPNQLGTVSCELNDLIRLSGIKVFWRKNKQNQTVYDFQFPQFTDPRGQKYNVISLLKGGEEDEIIEKRKMFEGIFTEEIVAEIQKHVTNTKPPKPSFHV